MLIVRKWRPQGSSFWLDGRQPGKNSKGLSFFRRWRPLVRQPSWLTRPVLPKGELVREVDTCEGLLGSLGAEPPLPLPWGKCRCWRSAVHPSKPARKNEKRRCFKHKPVIGPEALPSFHEH